MKEVYNLDFEDKEHLIKCCISNSNIDINELIKSTAYITDEFIVEHINRTYIMSYAIGNIKFNNMIILNRVSDNMFYYAELSDLDNSYVKNKIRKNKLKNILNAINK